MGSHRYTDQSATSEICPHCRKVVFPIVSGIVIDQENLEQSYTCPECKHEIWGSDGNGLKFFSTAILLILICFMVYFIFHKYG